MHFQITNGACAKNRRRWGVSGGTRRSLLAFVAGSCAVVSLSSVSAFADPEGTSGETCQPLTAETAVLHTGCYQASENVVFDSRVSVDGRVRLVLADGVVVDAKAGIGVPHGQELTIDKAEGSEGTGQLKATGQDRNAGIGADFGHTNGYGTITINGGVVEATGSGSKNTGDSGPMYWNGGAAIGDVPNGAGGVITINGGTVDATGGMSSAAIGGAYKSATNTITISGGTVNARGYQAGGLGADSPGIGGGPSGACGDVHITGGKVNAAGPFPGLYGASAIGCATGGTGGTITIDDGTVDAQSDGYMTGGIGVAFHSKTVKIFINGGHVKITGLLASNWYSSDWSNLREDRAPYFNSFRGAEIVINGGTVETKYVSCPNEGTFTLNGGSLTATDSFIATSITVNGGTLDSRDMIWVFQEEEQKGSLTINGGHVTAVGKDGLPGIDLEGGVRKNGEPRVYLNVHGGVLIAKGSCDERNGCSPAIGAFERCAKDPSCVYHSGAVNIDGDALVMVQGGRDGVNPPAPGLAATEGADKRRGVILDGIDATGPNSPITGENGKYVLSKDLELGPDDSLTVGGSDVSLTVPSGTTFDIQGKSTVQNSGELVIAGDVTVDSKNTGVFTEGRVIPRVETIVPSPAQITSTSITLKEVYGVVYCRDGVSCQASPVFKGLEPETSYKFRLQRQPQQYYVTKGEWSNYRTKPSEPPTGTVTPEPKPTDTPTGTVTPEPKPTDTPTGTATPEPKPTTAGVTPVPAKQPTAVAQELPRTGVSSFPVALYALGFMLVGLVLMVPLAVRRYRA